eukprot:m51a1_g3186 hypothetical protein (590) ;mRNA; f:424730-427015
MNTVGMYALMLLNAMLNVGIWSNYDSPGAVSPQLKEQWNFTAANLGQSYSVYSFPNLVLPIAYGAIMDRGYAWFDLPFFIVMCNAMITLSCVVIVFCGGSVLVFLVGRFLLGLGGEFILVCQYAAAAKWFPPSKMGTSNALIHFSGQTAAFCLFNVFPIIAKQTSMRFAFAVSAMAGGFSLLLGLLFGTWDRITTRRMKREKEIEFETRSAKEAETKLDEGATHAVLDDDDGSVASNRVSTEMRREDGPVPAAASSGSPSQRQSFDAPTANRSSADASGRPSTDDNYRPSTDSVRQSPVAAGGSMSDEAYYGLGTVGSQQQRDDTETEVRIERVDTARSSELRPLEESCDAVVAVQEHEARQHGAAARAWEALAAKLRSFPKLFWVLIFCCGYTSGVNLSYMAFSTAVLHEKWGVSEESAARYSSIVVATSIVAALPFGSLVDRIGQRLSCLLACALILVVVFPTMAFVPKSAGLAVPVVCLGCLGIVYAYIPTVQGSCYALTLPPELLSTGFGFSFCINMVTTIVFPLVLGYLRDWEGSYRGSLLVLAGAALIGVAADIIAIVMDRKIHQNGGISLQMPTKDATAAKQ